MEFNSAFKGLNRMRREPAHLDPSNVRSYIVTNHTSSCIGVELRINISLHLFQNTLVHTALHKIAIYM